MNTRFLGAICMIGSIVATSDGLRWAAVGAEDFDTLALVANTLWAIGGICGLLGLIMLNGVGRKTTVRVLVFVPIAGFVLLIVGNVMQLAGVVDTNTNTPAGLGWLFELAGMVLVGILAIAAKTWHDWRRFAPLLCVLGVPASFGVGALTGDLSVGAPLVYLAWVPLGYAVRTAELSREVDAWSLGLPS